MATLAAVTNVPALALLGEGGKLARSTEPFRRWYEDKQDLCLASPELKRVLEGQAHAAVLRLDGITLDIATIADREGGRHVLLTVPTGALPSLGDPGEALLDGALDDSPALVWLKDLDGRYVRVNSRFTTLLGTSEERLLGRTDGELEPAETVDGPRAQGQPEGVEEPLQLEYMVGAYQGRAAFVVLRFPVGDRQGTPTLVCGVAAPSAEAQVARSEAARLLRVERWSRLDADSVRAELLAEWGLLPDVRGAAGAGAASAPVAASAEQEAAVAEARAERATAVAERDSALAVNEKLTVELDAAQAKLTELERALQAARADGERGDAEARLAEQAAELDRALARERERAEELERTLALVRQRLGDDAEAARAEVQRARADADAARTEVERARADANAARAELETALARSHGEDVSGAELQVSEKARIAAEAALANTTAERDAALKARVALEGELAAAVERERVRAEGFEQAQARVRELEEEARASVMRADKAGDTAAQLLALDKARAAAEAALADAVAERDAALKARVALEGALAASTERERIRAEGLELAQARVHEIEAELRTTAMRADKAEIEAEQWSARVKIAEADLDRARKQIHELEDKVALARTQMGALEAEVKVGRAVADQLEGQLGAGQARVEELEAALDADRARLDELEAELEAGRTRVEELEGELEAGRARVDELEAQVEELGSAPASLTAEVVEPKPVAAEPPASEATELATVENVEPATPTASAGVSWQPTAKRSLSASLAREAVWRNVLKETVQVLGSEGGWDTVTAWLPDDANGLGCAAIWTAHRGLDRFESATLGEPLKRDGSLLDQALQAPHLTWLTDLDAVDDERLQAAAAHGMNSALLLPVRTGNTTIGLLELLTHDTVEPDAQIALSLEASALQLGRFGHLLSLGSKA